MKKLITFALLVTASFAQTNVSTGVMNGRWQWGSSAFAAGGLTPQLPLVWVDNNEATDGVNCGGFCSGTGFTAPGFELQLGGGGGTWITGPPSGCSFTLASYTSTTAGKQAAINAIEACRTFGINNGGVKKCTILDVPPGIYSGTVGVVIPQTSNGYASCFNVIRSTQDTAIAALPEPVCAGGIQDNVSASENPGLRNPSCDGTGAGLVVECPGGALGYQLGETTFCISGSTYSIASAGTPGLSVFNEVGSISAIHTTFSGIGDDLSTSPASMVDISVGDTMVIAGVTNTSYNGTYAITGFNHGTGVVTFNGPGGLSPSSGGTATGYEILTNVTASPTAFSVGNSVRIEAAANASYNGFATVQRIVSTSVYVTSTPAQIALSNSGTGTMSSALTLANLATASINDYNYYQYMYEDVCTANSCLPFQLCSPIPGAGNPCSGGINIGPDHWLFEDGAASMSAGVTNDKYLVSTGDNANQATAVSQYATHIHFRRYWAHGDWISLAAGLNSTIEAFDMRTCSTCSVVGSQVSQVMRPGAEGHIASTSGYGIKIDNDWFEGQSSCVFSGGQSNPAGPQILPIGSYVPTQDYQMGRVRCTFPYAWIGQGKVGHGNTHWSTQSIVRKNCQETKEGIRLLFYGFICENTDNSGGQAGIMQTLSTRQTSSTPAGQNYQANITDVTIQGAIYRNGCQDFSIGARSANAGNGGGVSLPMQRVLITDALHYNLTQTNPDCAGGDPGWKIVSANQTWQGTVTELGDGLHATFLATCSNDAGDCPAGPPSLGYESLGMPAGFPVFITGCTNTGFNVPTFVAGGHQVAFGVGPLATVGSAAWTGTPSAANLTVTYPWTGVAPGTVDSSGTCVFNNVMGGPRGLFVTHNTLITDAVSPIGQGPVKSNGGAFAIGMNFRDSIVTSSSGTPGTSGWFNSSVGTTSEGTATEGFNTDITSLTADHLVFAGRPSANYTAYGVNPVVPVLAPIMYFPATAWCSGATPTSNCVGFTGAMSASSLNLTLSDFHGYALRSDSSFHNTASDGTDLGARTDLIDNYQTMTTYTCQTPCGSPGPFPD